MPRLQEIRYRNFPAAISVSKAEGDIIKFLFIFV